MKIPATKEREFRIFDATIVKEPGRTGSLWRIHFSLKIPFLTCDFFEITPRHGKDHGESFRRYPIAEGDYVIADRGYSQPKGVSYIHSRKAFVLVRVNQQLMPFLSLSGKRFSLLSKLRKIKSANRPKEWLVQLKCSKTEYVYGRICAIKRGKNEAKLAIKKLERRAGNILRVLQKSTYEYEKYVFVFTTFPKNSFTASEILEWYRVRWQIELAFKRLKSLAQLGHLPKHDEDSAKAWLYGKLFLALLIQKIISHAKNISPWGLCLDEKTTSESMA